MFSFLSQEDIAEGWKIFFKRKKYKKNIETNIYLSQLPPHLWDKVNNSNNNIIVDKIFKYNLIRTQHDDKVLELYNEIKLNYSQRNIDLIKELYKYCSSINISGWIMIKAKEILNINQIYI